jgi:hypothetical protein
MIYHFLKQAVCDNKNYFRTVYCNVFYFNYNVVMYIYIYIHIDTIEIARNYAIFGIITLL